MNIEKMTVALRLRTSAQAFDLGAQMLREWAFQIYMPFVILMTTFYALMMLVFFENPLLIFFIIWFLKPLWDRIPLYVLSRKLFGEDSSVAKTMANWLPFSKSGLISSLIFRRISLVRSLALPVIALEGQSGKQRSRRIKIISHSLHGEMILLMVVCLALEFAILLFSFYISPEFLAGSGTLNNYIVNNDFLNQHFFLLCWFLSFLIIEPYYVAAGFSMYINRRTNLEAWDLELLFRKMANRFAQQTKMMLLLIMALLTFSFGTVTLQAQDEDNAPHWEVAPESAPQMVTDILENKPFTEELIETEWKLKPQFQKQKNQNQTNSTQSRNNNNLEWLTSITNFIVKLLLVILGVVLICLIAYAAYRVKTGQSLVFWRKPAKPSSLEVLPEFLQGVHEELKHEERVVPRAQALWQEGKARQAMSLLYRGGLLQLITEGRVQVKQHHTEQECQQQINSQIGGPLADYFKELTHSWIYTAYAHNIPPAETFRELCQGWENHLERAA